MRTGLTASALECPPDFTAVPMRAPKLSLALLAGATCRWLLPLLAATLAACADLQATSQQPAREDVEFIVVRHAEKIDDGSRDPPLRPEGEARARRLAERLHDAPVRAVYATGYRRTQATAAAVAADHALEVRGYDAARPAGAFVAQLRGEHTDGAVLVIGHSNTVPGIVAALCACTVAPIDESDYDNLYRVRIDAAGRATLAHARY